jgi:hypothetical protein
MLEVEHDGNNAEHDSTEERAKQLVCHKNVTTNSKAHGWGRERGGEIINKNKCSTRAFASLTHLLCSTFFLRLLLLFYFSTL